jgi:hypothetical protein
VLFFIYIYILSHDAEPLFVPLSACGVLPRPFQATATAHGSAASLDPAQSGLHRHGHDRDAGVCMVFWV